jgi:glycosyltransferase involved in cell wall biosynthesis
MSQLPLASIIVNNYNYGRFLDEAIDSALNQTYPHTEVIVVDDGSTDNSREIIASYGGQIVPLLKENGGQASGLNAGFGASRGEVIVFLDSDDILLSTAVERAVQLFSESDVIKVHWPLWEIDEHGKPTGNLQPTFALAEGDLREFVVQNGPTGYGWPPTSGNAWSRKFIKDISPIPENEYKISADIYLSVLAPVFGQMKKISEPQGCYRVHGQNNYWGNPFDSRLDGDLRRWEHSFGLLAGMLEEQGSEIDLGVWKSKSWFHQIYQSIQKISAVVPSQNSFILVDENQWETGEFIAGRRRIPFLERDGQYWGPPADDETAIREFERLRQAGASFMVFAWPAFWWLDYYSGLHEYLQARYRRILKNDRLIAFDLRV